MYKIYATIVNDRVGDYKMRKGRSLRILTIIALFVAISGLTIAYAAISDSFKDKEDSSLWNIQIQDLKAETSGSAIYTLPVISDTALSNYSVELQKPGDSVHLTFKVMNKGSLDAILSTLMQTKPNCKVNGNNNDVCSKIQYSLKYEDGNEVAQNDLLNHNGKKTIQYSIVYPTNAPAIEGKMTIDSIHLVLLYKQNV